MSLRALPVKSLLINIALISLINRTPFIYSLKTAGLNQNFKLHSNGRNYLLLSSTWSRHLDLHSGFSFYINTLSSTRDVVQYHQDPGEHAKCYS